MGILRVLSARSGDEQTAWDPAAAADDLDAQAALEEATHIFTRERKRGAIAVRVMSSGRSPERIEHFDPTAQQIILIPRVVGG